MPNTSGPVLVEGLLLGVAMGTSCLATCGPVLVPILLGEGQRIGRNAVVLVQFLAGRLAGYLLFGVAAWGVGRLLVDDTAWRALLFGATYLVLAIWLAWFGLSRLRRGAAANGTNCACAEGSLHARAARWPALFPAGLGLLTGLNLCPPFLLAFSAAAETSTLAGSLLFFGAFFLGTSLYFVPLPLLGALRREPAFRVVGRLAAVLIAVYYLALGIALLLGGIAGL